MENIIKTFQSMYKLKKYLSYEYSNTVILLDDNKNVEILLKLIIDYHNNNKTVFNNTIKYTDAYIIIEKNLHLTELDNIRTAQLLDIIFTDLKILLKNISISIIEMRKNSDKYTILPSTIIQSFIYEIDILIYLLFLNTPIIPKELSIIICNRFNINISKQEKMINKCDTIFRKLALTNSIFVCDFIPKEDLIESDNSITKTLDRKKKLITNSANKFIASVSDNISITDPYGLIILLSLIKTLKV